MKKLFCYGTLNVHAVQRELWGEAKEGLPSSILDYELKMWPETTVFYVERKPGERVAGKVYELTEEQLAATDSYETSAYMRVRLPVRQGETSATEVYVRNTEQ
jgi:gamma-glutamylcyclotransferase (GGCT)/AIG2-like uncharacterized protein YtfP